MHPDTAAKLITLNYQFYQTFAIPFSATRQRIQPGVRRALDRIDRSASVLDLGCGNGELAVELARRGHTGGYLGLDFSPGLIAEAQKALEKIHSPGFQARFQAANLADPAWDSQVLEEPFDAILCFAVLHHLPSGELREQVLRRVHARLAPVGRFIFSTWQFLNSDRLAERVLPWEQTGIDPLSIDPGDYLLDWRAGGRGMRYVHLYSQAELEALAQACGFRIIESYLSDGKEGNLGLYQVWVP